MKIFIPDLKKEYKLLNDTEIYLYPGFANYEFEQKLKLITKSLFGLYKKGKFNVTFNPSCELINEEMWQQNRYDSFFAVSKEEYSQELLETFHNPIDLKKLCPEVYGIKDNFININCDNFEVFVRKEFYENQTERYFDNFDKNKLFKSLEEVQEKITKQKNDFNSEQLIIYDEALKIGSVFDKKIGGKIPIKYQVFAGDTIQLLKLTKKIRYPKTKIPLSLIKINNIELTVLTEDLLKFDLG